MKIVIICNGNIQDFDFHKQFLTNSYIICADGGANYAEKLGITPNLVIGDLDSIEKPLLEELKTKTEVIEDLNQDKLDLELAIEYALTKNPDEIIILGALGKRIDHTLANIYTLLTIPKNINAKIIDETSEIFAIRDEMEFEGKVNQIISVIPVNAKGVSYSGLKWSLEDYDFEEGKTGICNVLKDEVAKISLKEGAVIVIKNEPGTN